MSERLNWTEPSSQIEVHSTVLYTQYKCCVRSTVLHTQCSTACTYQCHMLLTRCSTASHALELHRLASLQLFSWWLAALPLPHPSPWQPLFYSVALCMRLIYLFIKKIFIHLFSLAVLGLSYGSWDLPCIIVDLFCVACRLSCPVACGILVPWPGIEPESPALQVTFLTAGPRGKSFGCFRCLI